MKHSIVLPVTHRPRPEDITELRKLREWWEKRPNMAGSTRGKARIAHLTRLIEEAEQELQTHGKI